MRLDWRGALGIILSALLLWYLLHGQVGVVLGVLSTSNLWLWAASALWNCSRRSIARRKGLSV